VSGEVTTARIARLLHARHEPPEWACFQEFTTMTGGGFRRSGGYRTVRFVDFLAVNLWPSKGISKSPRVVAYEIKVSRSDFFREIQDPSKRAQAMAMSSEFVFAVPSGLVKKDEVPEGCGLLYATTAGLRQMKAPRQKKPDDWDWNLICSLARRVADERPKDSLAAWRVAGRELTYEELVQLAISSYKRDVGETAEAIANGATKKLIASKPYQDLLDIAAAVKEKCGWRVQTGDQFRRWFDEQLQGAVDRDTISGIRQARSTLDRVLERVAPAPKQTR